MWIWKIFVFLACVFHVDICGSSIILVWMMCKSFAHYVTMNNMCNKCVKIVVCAWVNIYAQLVNFWMMKLVYYILLLQQMHKWWWAH